MMISVMFLLGHVSVYAHSKPEIFSISPISIPNSTYMKLVVEGINFDNNAKIHWRARTSYTNHQTTGTIKSSRISHISSKKMEVYIHTKGSATEWYFQVENPNGDKIEEFMVHKKYWETIPNIDKVGIIQYGTGGETFVHFKVSGISSNDEVYYKLPNTSWQKVDYRKIDVDRNSMHITIENITETANVLIKIKNRIYESNIKSFKAVIEKEEENDFYMDNMRLNKSSVKAGDTVRVDVDAKYRGNSEEKLRVYTGYYLSTNREWGSDDKRLDYDVSRLSKNDTRSEEYENLTIPPGTEARDYYILAVADHEEEYSEINEGNNVEYKRITVTSNTPIDTTPPVIHLNGESTVNLKIGDRYNERGATAQDNVDGNISANIVIGGDTVDTSRADTYTVTYNVRDNAGNRARQKTRRVVVSSLPDTTRPVIHLNGESTVNLKVGDRYDEKGATAQDDVDGNISAKIVIGGDTVDTSRARNYTITYNVRDNAGNHAIEVTRRVVVKQVTTNGEVPPSGAFVKVVGSRTIRSEASIYGGISTRLKVVPDGWILKVTDAHSNQKVADGYIWWEVKDKTDELEGWMVAKKADGSEEYLEYDESKQDEWEKYTLPYIYGSKADDIVEEYIKNQSFDKEIFDNFPEELINAITGAEGSSGNNEIVSFDCGRGIGQITANSWVGKGSGVQCYCGTEKGYMPYEKTNLTKLVNVNYDNYSFVRHFKNVIEGKSYPRDAYKIKKESSENPYWYGIYKYTETNNNFGVCKKYKFSEPECTCNSYTNTPLGIVTNLKDKHKVLTTYYKDSLSKNKNRDKAIILVGAVWRYNHGIPAGVIKSDSTKYLSLVNGHLKNPDNKTEIKSLKRILKNYKEYKIFSPVDMQIQDSEGNVTGVVNGKVVENIPNSIYDEENERILVLLPDENYEPKLVATGSGTYGFTATNVEDGVVEEIHVDAAPVKVGEVHEYNIDWNKAKDDKADAVEVKIDKDGDGTFEKTVKTTAEFDGSVLEDSDDKKDDVVKTKASAKTPIFRLYNKRTGAQLYARGEADKNKILAKFRDFEFTDGAPAFWADLSTQAGLTPIYRLYNRRTGAQLYTRGDADKNKILAKFHDFEFTDGVPAFWASLTDNGTTPIFRLYNRRTGMQLYTRGEADKNKILAKFHDFEFTDDGPAFYASLTN